MGVGRRALGTVHLPVCGAWPNRTRGVPWGTIGSRCGAHGGGDWCWYRMVAIIVQRARWRDIGGSGYMLGRLRGR